MNETQDTETQDAETVPCADMAQDRVHVTVLIPVHLQQLRLEYKIFELLSKLLRELGDGRLASGLRVEPAITRKSNTLFVISGHLVMCHLPGAMEKWLRHMLYSYLWEEELGLSPLDWPSVRLAETLPDLRRSSDGS